MWLTHCLIPQRNSCNLQHWSSARVACFCDYVFRGRSGVTLGPVPAPRRRRCRGHALHRGKSINDDSVQESVSLAPLGCILALKVSNFYPIFLFCKQTPFQQCSLLPIVFSISLKAVEWEEKIIKGKILKAWETSNDASKVCVTRKPKLVEDESQKFPSGYPSCNIICSEHIPPVH